MPLVLKIPRPRPRTRPRTRPRPRSRGRHVDRRIRFRREALHSRARNACLGKHAIDLGDNVLGWTLAVADALLLGTQVENLLSIVGQRNQRRLCPYELRSGLRQPLTADGHCQKGTGRNHQRDNQKPFAHGACSVWRLNCRVAWTLSRVAFNCGC